MDSDQDALSLSLSLSLSLHVSSGPLGGPPRGRIDGRLGAPHSPEELHYLGGRLLEDGPEARGVTPEPAAGVGVGRAVREQVLDAVRLCAGWAEVVARGPPSSFTNSAYAWPRTPIFLTANGTKKMFSESGIPCSLALLYSSDGAPEVQAVPEKVPERRRHPTPRSIPCCRERG